MALVLNQADIGKKFKIVRGNVEGPGVEVYRWDLAAIGPNAQGNIIYSFKKDPNDNEDQWVELPKSFFDNGFALISHDNPMNPAAAAAAAGGKRRIKRRHSKTKRAHKTKRRRSRSRR